MILNTIRTIDNDQAREHAIGNENSMKENLAICMLNSEDLKNLKMSSESTLNISSKFGQVNLKAIELDKVPKGMIYVPISIWANQ